MSKIKNYDILDLSKFILSIMIVAIHTSLLPELLYPWLRLAVPLFFIISSFLLFKKINNSSKEESNNIIKKFVFRQIKLYLFWFIVLLPFTVYLRRDWFYMGIRNGIRLVVQNTLFSSTFIASWFIVATITATVIIYKLSNKKNYKLLFVIFTLIYFGCCTVSSYNTFITNFDLINKIYSVYLYFFPSPIFSFPVALIWVFIGKMFADNNINYKIKNKKIFLLSLITFSIFLFIEWKFVIKISNIYSNDCYFFLLPLSILIFKLLLNINIDLKYNKILRNISTITYPLHASIAPFVFSILDKFIDNITLIGILNFCMTLSICYIACFIIFKLVKIDRFKFLKYSY